MARAKLVRSKRRGLATVELALLLPFIVMLLLGTWELGRLMGVCQILNNAAREGARQAATGQNTNTDVQTTVKNYLYIAMLGQGMSTTAATKVYNDAVVTVQDLTNPGTDVSAASQLDQIKVTVTVPFNDVRWISLNLVTSSSTQLTGSASWFSVKDQIYPTTQAAPAGY